MSTTDESWNSPHTPTSRLWNETRTMSPYATIAVALLAAGQAISTKSADIIKPIAADKSLVPVAETMTMGVNEYYSASALHAVQHIQEAVKCILILCHEANEGEDIAYLVNAATKLGEVAEALLPTRPTGDFPANVISVDFQSRQRA